MKKTSKRFRSLSIPLTAALLTVFLLTGCIEVLLRNMTPEQRALYAKYLENSEELVEEESQGSFAENDGQAEQGEPFTLAALVEDDQCEVLELAPPRGLACLHCMQPEARHQARILSVLLFRSCLKNIAINYLVDGSFSFDEELLKEQITLLTSNDRRLFLHIYLTNGPSQRRWSKTAVRGFGTKVSPEEFREKISSDDVFQSRFQEIVLRLVPVLELAASRGGVISLVPQLEDNLSDRAFENMVELTLEALPENLPVTFGRNPCSSCYRGNGREGPAGMFYEAHTSSGYINVQDAVLSNDGAGYSFYSERERSEQDFAPDDITLEDLGPLRDTAARSNSVFILWSAARQGLPQFPNSVPLFDAPAERMYQLPSVEERIAIIRFLRGNLQP